MTTDLLKQGASNPNLNNCESMKFNKFNHDDWNVTLLYKNIRKKSYYNFNIWKKVTDQKIMNIKENN